jgi:hypothetical protein
MYLFHQFLSSPFKTTKPLHIAFRSKNEQKKCAQPNYKESKEIEEENEE